MVSRLFNRSKKNSSAQEPHPALSTHAQVDDDVFLPDSGRTPDNQVPKIYPNLTGILTGVCVIWPIISLGYNDHGYNDRGYNNSYL